ncbi:MAG: SynChlorMet cassette protein ScmC [candidate division WOR-3 bacterium]|nr:MAG: SynChlorMet cassette protein ScmC [candidate division WOR-3 bacterium]
MPHGLKLEFADGQRWTIVPVDGRAALIVAELGRVMRLGPGKGGRELWVAVCEESDQPDASVRSEAESAGAVVCRLVAPTDRETRVSQMERIDSVVTREALSGGGLLLHSALAEYHGSGFIMAGPSQTGKSTASRRFRFPWRSLCDDRTLVVRDRNGCFWAHPMPTWSRFKDRGSGGSWPVEHAVPLRAMFFLAQSPADRLEPVNATQAAALILDSAVNLALKARELTEEDTALAHCNGGVNAARALASAVPAYSLNLSRDGRFWEEIERVLPVEAVPGSGRDDRDWSPVSVESLMAGDSQRMVYTGTSMDPSLREPDLLEVKPYSAERVRPGDVVCFKPPGTDRTIVHRVVGVGPDGIRTRGDNKIATDDPWVLRQGDIIGRVVAAQREGRRRAVHGGWKGRRSLLVRRGTLLGRGIRRLVGSLPHALYDFVAGLGPFDRLLPSNLRPRLVRFRCYAARRQMSLKLLMGRQTIGRYVGRCDEWRIRRPFRLFVDEQALRRAAAPVLSSEVRE